MLGVKDSQTKSKLVVHAPSKFGPPTLDLKRVIGSLDLDGKGTKHTVERQANPFIFLDEAKMPRGVSPPFKAHPHTGLVANTIPMNNVFSSLLWDNLNGHYGPLWGGGVFQLKAGCGILHDEGKEVSREELEKYFGKETVAAACDGEVKEMNHICMLWFNPGVGSDFNEELKTAEKHIHDPSDIPILDLADGVKARLLFGEYGGKKSPAVTWSARVLVLDVTDSREGANRTMKFNLPADHSTAMVHNTLGSVAISVSDDAAVVEKLEDLAGCQACSTAEVGCLTVREWDGDRRPSEVGRNALEVKVVGKGTARYLVLAGKPLEKNWVKLLGNGGALIGPSEEWVRAKMKEYEADKDNFGKKTAPRVE